MSLASLRLCGSLAYVPNITKSDLTHLSSAKPHTGAIAFLRPNRLETLPSQALASLLASRPFRDRGMEGWGNLVRALERGGEGDGVIKIR
jgi:hypothetical protein